MQRKNREGKTLITAVRFGNVLGSKGSVVPVFQKQIQEGGPLTITHKDMTRYFMTIPEAVQLVLEAASITRGGEIFVLDMGQPVKIYDLATTMIQLSGLKPEKDIKIEVTGLRPGEKLYEELSLTDEKVAKTSNNKIFMLKSNGHSDENIESEIDTLCAFTSSKEYTRAYEQVKVLVPSFKNGILH
jgi:FlaA1/EpsC-like NDP-sugar epimerase